MTTELTDLFFVFTAGLAVGAYVHARWGQPLRPESKWIAAVCVLLAIGRIAKLVEAADWIRGVSAVLTAAAAIAMLVAMARGGTGTRRA